MARPRKPALIRKLEGNRSRTPIPREIEPPGRPRCPAALTADEAGRWRDVVASLPVELLTRADEQVLERMAVAWACYRETSAMLRKSTLLVKGQFGNAVRSPLLIIRKQAAEEMEACGQSLGLSPVARTRIVALEERDDDPMARLLDTEATLALTNDRKLDS
jgi:P27 family predicted phage terminase small subunit